MSLETDFKRYLPLFLLDFFSISTMINAPNILIGYGLILPAMMISLLFIRPLHGSIIFIISHILASILLVYTHSAFTLVILLSLIVRSAVLLILAILMERGYLKNVLALLLSIVSLDTFLAYSLALLYYGKDAIEVGLDIYSLAFIPFVYLTYRLYTGRLGIYSITPMILMISYFFSSAYFYAAPLNIFTVVMLILTYLFINRDRRRIFLVASVLGSIIFGVLSTPSINYNIWIVLYPYRQDTLMGQQWVQDREGPYCMDGNVFKSTYDPERLRIIDKCVTVQGVVVSEITRGEDGDIFFDVKLDPQYEHMLSLGSWILRKGSIHVEIVPEDQDNVYIPSKGDRVRIIGVWVVDTDHGSYSEIHPAWHIEVVD